MRPKPERSEVIYQGRIIDVHRDELIGRDGRRYIREVVLHPGAVAVVPFLSPERIILIRQYRYAVDSELIELPAGTIKEGESPESCAFRELEEEIGYAAGRLVKLASIHTSPGVMNELLHIFAGFDLEKSSVNLEADEELEAFEIGLGEALDMVRSGGIIDSKTICGLFLANDRFSR